MLFKKYDKIILLFIALTAWSCKSVKTTQQPPMAVLPDQYSNNSDTTNSAQVKWKSYFADQQLVAIVDSALLYNWDVLAAMQRIRAAQADVLLNKGAMLPLVTAGGSAGLNKFGDYTMDGAGNRNTEIYNGQDIPTRLPDYFVGLQTSWEVDLWGKLSSRKKAAVARFLATAEGKKVLVTNLIAEIAVNYYDLLALDEALKMITATVSLQENALEIVKIQKESAAANELAVEQFEARLLELRDMRLDVLQQISQTENRINLLSGSYPKQIGRDSSFFTRAVPFTVKLGVPAALLINRPDIRQAELELVAAKADVKAAKAAFYPSLNIGGSIGFQSYKTSLLFQSQASLAFSLLGNLSAPLLNRSAIKAAFYTADAVQLESLYNYHKTIVSGYVEVYNEMQQLKTLEQRVELKTRAATVLNRSIETSSELFRTGRANYLEVLVAQENALKSKLELINTRKNQFQSTINIYKALGGGWQ
jgi:NodT family efflux transporter outer membrane factor (OMF) lipoprotein